MVRAQICAWRDCFTIYEPSGTLQPGYLDGAEIRAFGVCASRTIRATDFRALAAAFRARSSNRAARRSVSERMSTVNGFYCRNCADVELAKKGMDPAHPGREYSGGEVYVPPSADSKQKLGVNEPEKDGGP